MKLFFKPIPLVLFLFSIWITIVCASLLNFDQSGNLIAHSYSIWGDWSAHFTFITALKERGFHWIARDNPIFPGVPFHYPFLSHVLTYFFSVLTTLDVIHATYISSLILIFALPFVLYRLFLKLPVSPFAALVSVISFLLVGGVQWLDSGLNAKEPLTNQFSEASIFTQFILFELFPQRAFLFGMIGLSLLLTSGLTVKVWSRFKVIWLALGLSCLALTHVHSWLAAGALIFCLFLLPRDLPSGFLSRQKTFFFGVGVASISALFLAFLLLRGNHGNDLSWDPWMPGWAQNPKAGLIKAQNMNFFMFWFYNTALFLPFSFFGIYLSWHDARFRAIALTACLLFVVASLINTQPYYYDNLKLFTYAFFFFAPFVGITLEKVSKLPKIPKVIAYGIAILLLAFQVTSATLDLESFRNGLQYAQFFSVNEFKLAEEFKKVRTSSEAIVLINPRHNHWIPCLTGNPVAMGYGGWLWTWGINAGPREKQIQEVLLGGPNADSILKSLSVSYIVIQENDKIGNESVGIKYFNSKFKNIIRRDGWLVYSVLEAPISPSKSVR